jgi:uncharacterized protein YneR
MMAWGKVDDNLAFHPKVAMAGNEAMGLWVRALSYCCQQLTDGFIPAVIVNAMQGAEIAQRLVEVGLWLEVENGYQFKDWCEYQPSSEEVRAKRAKTSAARSIAGTASASKRYNKDLANEQQESNKALTNDLTNEQQKPNPVPVPVPKEPLLSDSGESDDGRFPDEVYAMCNKLADYIRANGSKVGTVGPEWWKAADRLIRLDGHDLELIYQVMDWCQRDEFWQGNIRSMPKFRQQFDQLRIRMGNSKPKVVETAGYAPGVVTRRKKGEGVMYAVDAIDWDGSDDWKPSE